MDGARWRSGGNEGIMAVLVAFAWLVSSCALAAPSDGQMVVHGSGSSEAGQNQLLDEQSLETLVGPIALYPDDLLAIVLPASTYPLQIVQADRYLKALKDDPSLEPDDDWDRAVVALLNYPEVVEKLSGDLDWTWELGQAVMNQEQELLAAVKRFRRDAHLAGNLTSDERQRVDVDDEKVEIRPADPEVIYVPYYDPSLVRARHASPVYHYYPRPFPLYYYPYMPGHYLTSGTFWGVTSAFSIGWRTGHLHYHLHGHRSHPYFGRSYAYRHYRYWRPRAWASTHYRGHPRYRHHAGNRWRGEDHYRGARPPQERQSRPRSTITRPPAAGVHPRLRHMERSQRQVRPRQSRPSPASSAPRLERRGSPAAAQPGRPRAVPRARAAPRDAGPRAEARAYRRAAQRNRGARNERQPR